MMIAAIKLVKHFFPANQLLVACTGFFLLLTPAFSDSYGQNKKKSAKKDRLSLPGRASVKKATEDFKACRTAVMQDLKEKKFPRKALKGKLSSCQNTFAGGKLYLDCKRAALKGSAKKGARKGKAKLKECRSLLGRASYSPKRPMPFLIHKGQAYFAGLSLNGTAQPFVNRPNFFCDPLTKAFKNVETPKFMFFGNGPNIFKSSDKAVIDAWQKESDTAEAFFLGDLAKIYENDEGRLTYFPSGECFLEDRSSSIYKSLSIYYLLSPSQESTFPYVGVAFYENDYKSITVKDLISRFQKQMGRKLVITKRDRKTFLSARKIKSFDEEGDPKNVCKGKGVGRYLVVIKARETSKRFPDYVLLANIEQLCSFGEETFNRLKAPQ